MTSLFARIIQTMTAYAGDEALLQAAVSAASNVIVADGEMASEEFETALAGVMANPILQKGYDQRMLEEALYDAIGRARTRAGRADNIQRVAAVAGRSIEQRENVFLVATDVADHDGIMPAEHAALAEIAAALVVDKMQLLKAQPGPASPRADRTTG